MTARPGYLVTLTIFFPADPSDPDEMRAALQAMEGVDGFRNEVMALSPATEATVKREFVKKHKSAPPAADAPARPVSPEMAPAEAEKAGVAYGEDIRPFLPPVGERLALPAEPCRHGPWVGEPHALRCGTCGKPASEIPADELLDMPTHLKRPAPVRG